MFDLITVDLDGTLLTTDKTVTQRTQRVIRDVVQRGVKLVLASARPPRSVAATFKLLGLKTCIIAYNGALIYDPPTKRVVHHQSIDQGLARRFVDRAREMHPEVLVSVEVLDRWFTDRVNPQFETETSKLFDPDKLGPINSWLNCNVTKILLQGPEPMLTDLRTKLYLDFPNRLAFTQCDGSLMQVMAAGVNKGAALIAVADYYQIPLQRTLAIGDEANDIPMLKTARVGIAMASAPEQVVQAADYVTAENDEDGVAEALERFVL